MANVTRTAKRLGGNLVVQPNINRGACSLSSSVEQDSEFTDAGPLFEPLDRPRPLVS
jgi:hypothetical protein